MHRRKTDRFIQCAETEELALYKEGHALIVVLLLKVRQKRLQMLADNTLKKVALGRPSELRMAE